MTKLVDDWIFTLKFDNDKIQEALDKLEKLIEDLEECQKKITESVTVTLKE